MRGHPIPYSEHELSFIKQHKQLPRKELADLFNETFNRDVSTGNIERLCKRKGWSNGNNGKFKKGQPFNPNSGAKAANKTSFKSGHKPNNLRQIGDERVNKDGYIEIKMHKGTNSWYLKSRMIWMEHHGPIPKGYVIKFYDNNKLNCTIENLVMISRQENAILRKLDYEALPPKLRDNALAIAKLKAMANDVEKIL